MKKEEIKSRMIVKNIVTEEIGVLYEGDDYGCINDLVEVAIVYKGDDKNPVTPSFLGTKFEDLESYKLKPEDLLTDGHIDRVCRPNADKTCRYLIVVADRVGCAKVLGDTSIAWNLDNRVGEGSIRATGNNCGGRYGTYNI